MCACVRACVRVCDVMYISRHMCVYVYVYVYVHVHTHMSACIGRCVCMHACIFMYTYVYVCIAYMYRKTCIAACMPALNYESSMHRLALNSIPTEHKTVLTQHNGNKSTKR